MYACWGRDDKNSWGSKAPWLPVPASGLNERKGNTICSLPYTKRMLPSCITTPREKPCTTW